jgi:hypothetical protein
MHLNNKKPWLGVSQYNEQYNKGYDDKSGF